MNEAMLDRIFAQIEKYAVEAVVARAETEMLSAICGYLMAEVARLSPEPQAAIDRLAGNLAGITDKALAGRDLPLQQAQISKLVDNVIGVAETALGKPYNPAP